MEKRTIHLQDVGSFFGNNEVVLEKVMEAAARATSSAPFVSRFLSHKDRWHIMNLCMNRVSSVFGPFHVFFNEARRCKSYYRSAWYLYTLTSQQNLHHGRFFVTPYKPVLSKVDVGVRRLRIELVNEQEMREVCAGGIKPPDWGFFNNRHRKRWELLVKMGELFENQLVIVESGDAREEEEGQQNVAGGESDDATPTSLDERDVNRTWSPSRSDFARRRRSPNPRDLAETAARSGRIRNKKTSSNKDIDNCIMRVHIPYPSYLVDGACAETSSKDVVLFD